MRRTLLIPFVVALAIGAQAHAGAYRWVDSEGRVSYGDRPPDGASASAVRDAGATRPAAQPGADDSLPYAVRSAAGRHPVRLYTTAECPACELARAYLTQRGVPFAERTLRSEADVLAFRKLGFSELRFPALSVGKERAQGFAPDGWTQLIDTAGYPKSSMLPRGWRAAPAQPLAAAAGPVAIQKPPADSMPRPETVAEHPFLTPATAPTVRADPPVAPQPAQATSQIRF